MQELEVPLLARFRVAVHGVLVTLAKKTYVAGILQVLDTRRIAAKTLVEASNCHHIGRSPMPQLLFTVAADLLANFGQNGEQGYREERQRQHQRDHHVAALLPAMVQLCSRDMP